MAWPLLHIGYHKTATTWFQTRFYPAVSNARLVPADVVRALLLAPRPFDFEPETVRRRVGEFGARSILCHEELSGSIHSGGLHGCFTKEVGQRLHGAFPSARIVIFLRNQVDIIESSYRQYVRIGGSYGLDRYLHPDRRRPYRTAPFDVDHFDYWQLVSFYTGLFGRERVELRLFEDFVRDPRAFCASYARELGLEVDVRDLDSGPVRQSFGDRTLTLARLLNAFTRNGTAHKYYLLHVPGLHQLTRRMLTRWNRLDSLRRRRPPREFLGARNVEAIEARFAESNRRLAAEYGLPLADRGYPWPASLSTASASSGR